MSEDDLMKDIIRDNVGDALRDELGLKLPSEVAAMLGVTEQTLAQWRSKHLGPIVTRLGKSVFYHLDDLRKWTRPPATYRLPTAEESGRVVAPGHD